MSYPYNLFKAKKMISLKTLDEIFRIKNSKDRESCLTEPRIKLDIEEYIKKNKLDTKELEQFGILKKISTYYENFISDDKDIESFYNKFISFYSVIKSNKNHIEIFIKMYSKIKKNRNVKKKYNNKYLFTNPLNSDEINFGFLNEHFFKERTDKYIYGDSDKIKIALDVLLYGNIINISLPSPGAITFKISDEKDKYSFYTFIDKIINNDILDKNIVSYIPLYSLDIADTIADLLLNVKLNNNVFLDINHYDNMKRLIKSIINNIEISLLDDILTIDKHEKHKKKYNTKYIIPYIKDKKNPAKIVSIKKEDIDKLKTSKEIIDHNSEMIKLVINNDKDIFLSNINKDNYKNILASFLFIIIELVYSISFKYIQHINLSIGNLLDKRKEGRFSRLNIEDAFEYTSLLMKSLLKFKLILLNNFYDLFLPVNIGDKNYGMKIDDNGCYVPESVFLQDSSYIYDNYPFMQHDGSSFITGTILEKFLININKKNDIYDKNYILESGGEVFNNDIMSKSMEILNNYYILLQKNNNFDLFIINKIKTIFKDKIPSELIPDVVYNIKLNLNRNNKNKIDTIISNIFEYNYEKSIRYYDKLKKIEYKIKNYKGSNTDNIYFLKDKLQLITRVYYFIAKSIEIIVELYYTDIKYKNSLLKKFNEIKHRYTNLIAGNPGSPHPSY